MARFAYQRVIQNLSIFGYLDLFKYPEWIGTWVQEKHDSFVLHPKQTGQ